MTSWVRRNWDIALLLALAAAVYRPWDTPHLPLTDFGLFFAARGDAQSFFSQYAGVAGYYMGEGRFCLIIYLYMVIGGALFDTWAPGWHWMYFALNTVVLLLARNLLSRLGISRIAVFVALALWATMGPTAELWIRPAGEPIALIFFLTALHHALNFGEADDWRRRAIVIAACAVGIALTKELLLVLLPAGWLMSRLVVHDRQWRWAPWAARDTYLLRLVSVCVAVVMVPIIYVATHASAASYAAQYSASSTKWASFLERLEIVSIPSGPRLHWLSNFSNDPVWSVIRTLPNLLWVGMVAIAVFAERRRSIGWPLLIAVIWVAAGVLAYLPWPSQGMFYMMPFALGTMFIAAHALSRPLTKGSKNLRAALGVAALLIVVASIEARSTLYQHRLRAKLNGDVMAAIQKQGGAQVLIGAVPAPLPGTGGWANHLRGFGRVSKGMRVGSWSDMKCADAKAALKSTPGAVVVSSAGGCGELVEGSLVISGSVPRSRWPIIWKEGRSEGRMYVARATDVGRLSVSNSF